MSHAHSLNLIAALGFSLVFHSISLADDVSFDREVMAVFSKAGCNSGPCHGNLNGKGDFRLSLRGQDSAADFLSLMHDLSGRRVNRIDASQSLVLLKPTSQVPHEGGQRFTQDSAEYKIIRKWIDAGCRGPDTDESPLKELRVTPRQKIVILPDRSFQIKAIAEFSDGTTRDVTNLATFEVTNFVASVSAMGQVKRESFGESVILVRYMNKQKAIRCAFIDTHEVTETLAESNYVDTFVNRKLRSLGLAAAERATDQVFVRRAFLDTLGLPPTAAEARSFVEDENPAKRNELINRLLARTEFADFWTLKWCDLLRVEEKLLDTTGTAAFHGWIRDCFAEGKPLNEFAAAILKAKGSTYKQPESNLYRALRDPLSRGETVARVFLGHRLQCAKCHNHPFDVWTQDDYYSWASVFAHVDYKIVENKRRDKLDKSQFIGEQIVIRKKENKVQNARTGDDAKPRLLDGQRTKVSDEGDVDRLDALASWIQNDNQQFALAQVNRIWYHLMGRGIVDPVDDFRVTNPASHPELLKALADEFIACDFDVRQVVRTIMESHTYQAVSNETDGLLVDNFGANRIRRLSAEQLLDAQCQLVGIMPEFNGYEKGLRAAQIPGVKKVFRDRSPSRDDRFLTKFGKPARIMSCECERSDSSNLSQVIMLLSDQVMENRLATDCRFVELSESKISDDELIDEMYWAAVSRKASDNEKQHIQALFRQAGNRTTIVQDVMWALMNSKEFLFRF